MSIPNTFRPLGSGGGLPILPQGWRHVESVVIPRAESRTTVFTYNVNNPGTPAEDYDITLRADITPIINPGSGETNPVVLGNAYTGSQAPGLWTGYYYLWGGWKIGAGFNGHKIPGNTAQTTPFSGLGIMRDGVVTATVAGQVKTVDMRGLVSIAGRKHQFSVFRDKNEDVTLYHCEFHAPHHHTAYYPVHNDETGQDGIYELYKKTVYPIPQ